MLPNFCYTYVNLYIDFGPALESYRGTALTMRIAFRFFPCHPDEGVILGLKGKFGTWTFRGEACKSDEGQSCLLNNSKSNKCRFEFVNIFETSGMNNLNLICFLFTFFSLPEFLSCCALWSAAGQFCLPFSFGLQILLGSHEKIP